jgi:hypothetical protein
VVAATLAAGTLLSAHSSRKFVQALESVQECCRYGSCTLELRLPPCCMKKTGGTVFWCASSPPPPPPPPFRQPSPRIPTSPALSTAPPLQPFGVHTPMGVGAGRAAAACWHHWARCCSARSWAAWSRSASCTAPRDNPMASCDHEDVLCSSKTSERCRLGRSLRVGGRTPWPKITMSRKRLWTLKSGL